MLWDDDIIGRSVPQEKAKALIRTITEDFLTRLEGMPMHKVQAALGPDRGILHQLQIARFLWNGDGTFFPAFSALYFMNPSARRNVELDLHGFLEFLKDLYSEKGPGPYSLKAICEGLGGPNKRPIAARTMIISAHLARTFGRYFQYFSGSPTLSHPSSFPSITFFLSDGILDYQGLERAWNENIRPFIASIVSSSIIERSPRVPKEADRNHEWDLFICHASEDKLEIVTPLAQALREKGLRVWYDEFELRLGDSLRRKIDDGLARSRYGIVVLSKSFFEKEWPQKELDGLNARETGGKKVILPIWRGVSHDDVLSYSPLLADRGAARSSDGIENIVEKILSAIQD